MKFNFKRTLFALGLASGMFLSQGAFAVPAYPGIIKYEQPNGQIVNMHLQGDEFLKRAYSVDGYSLMFNEDGAYEYAVLDGDQQLVPSGILAADPANRKMPAISLLSRTSKGLDYSEQQLSAMKSIRAMYDEEIGKKASKKSSMATGNTKLLCILIGFDDLRFSKSQSQFDNLFNQVGYSEDRAAGSVKDFYKENSHGKLNLSVTVAGPYTARNRMSYYGGSNDANARELMAEAFRAADADVDYSDFDNDNDGDVDGVHIIYAGHGEEAGASSNAIWAHASSTRQVRMDGVYVGRYSCSAELRGNRGRDITRIGVVCHEIGHVLGAPDYYDTDYDRDGQFPGTGKWDLMASGSWNDNGASPAHHNAFTKTAIYGWAEAKVLSSASSIEMKDVVESNNDFYRINTATSGEYFLLENRQQKGFDSEIPGHGLVIYHVDKNAIREQRYNKLNNSFPQLMYAVCASASGDPSSRPSSYGTVNGRGLPFPGSSRATSFTDDTEPSSRSRRGDKTRKPVTNINERYGEITFDFMGGGSAPDTGNGGDTDTGNDGDNITEAPSTPKGFVLKDLTTDLIKFAWSASSDDGRVTGYEISTKSGWSTKTSSNAATIEGLRADSDYDFFVKAIDNDGNYSDKATFSVTTPKRDNADYRRLTDGVTITNSLSSSDQSDTWYVDVPSGISSMNVTMTCRGSDYDLYSMVYDMPTKESYDWKEDREGGEEHTVNSPKQGRHYIMVNRYDGSDDYKITVEFNSASHSSSMANVQKTDKHDVSINCYPNPATDRFTVSFPTEHENRSVQVVNANGAVVLSKENVKGKKMSVEGLEQGMYIIMVKEDNKLKHSQKLIVE